MLSEAFNRQNDTCQYQHKAKEKIKYTFIIDYYATEARTRGVENRNEKTKKKIDCILTI